MIKGFLFDLDGTLVDTHRANFEAYKRALLDFGVDISWSDFRPTIGHQAKVFLPVLAPSLTSEQYTEIRRRKAEYYKEYLHLTVANDPLIAFMKAMAKNYPVGLVTTAKRSSAMAILDHHDLANTFQTIIAGDDVERHKPDPDGYLLALERLDLTPEDTLAFEDSETGRAAADAAGIPVIMVKEFIK